MDCYLKNLYLLTQLDYNLDTTMRMSAICT